VTEVKPRLDVKSPVPSDIDIAQAITPIHIAKIAESLGLTADEYDLYGKYKAKVLQFPSTVFLPPEHLCTNPAPSPHAGQALRAGSPSGLPIRKIWCVATQHVCPRQQHAGPTKHHIKHTRPSAVLGHHYNQFAQSDTPVLQLLWRASPRRLLERARARQQWASARPWEHTSRRRYALR
jgi:hypothetical protein